MAATSEGFSASQRAAIDKAIREAETASRYEFSVYVGAAEGATRPFAERLHASLSTPARSVLLMVDPAARMLEVVTGAEVRRVLDDGSVRLATAAMQTDFGSGDLVGGITRGLQQLAAGARAPQVLHTDRT
jgi:uncharacterized membrane protein YgcG